MKEPLLKSALNSRCIPSLNFTQRFGVSTCVLVSVFYRYSRSFMLLQREADELAAEQRKQRQLQQARLKELELQREAERQRLLDLQRQQQEAIRQQVHSIA